MRITRFARSAAVAPVLAAIMFLAPNHASAEDGITKDTIKIGLLGPQTGRYYIYGALVQDGIETAFNLANDAGGIHGRKIQVVRADDRCDGATGVVAAKKLVHDDKVFLISGGGCTDPALAGRPIIEEAKVPWVIADEISDSHTDPVRPYIWRTCLSSRIESEAQGALALQRGAKKIAMISHRDAWGQARRENILNYLKRKNVSLVADEEIGLDANDATPQMLRIRQSGADAVLLVVFPKVASVFIRDAAKLGYKPLMVGSTALGNLDDIRGQVGMGDGPMQNVFALNHVAYSQNDPEMAEWKERYKKYYPDKDFTIYNVMGIPAGMVIVEALKRAGPDLTRQRFAEVMNSLSDFQTGVYAGPITCSETDHQCNKSPAVVGLENGKLVNKGTVTVD